MSSVIPRKIIAAFLWFVVAAPNVALAQLPPSADEVFRLRIAQGPDRGARLDWSIAPGTYLYRDKVAVTTAAGTPVPITTTPGVIKDDPNFGSTEIYHNKAEATIAAKDMPETGALRIAYQGCAEQGICYPPVTKMIDVATLRKDSAISDSTGTAAPGVSTAPEAVSTLQTTASPSAESGFNPAALLSGGPLSILASFLGFGLLLAFTPCVFPMIPILSGMLARSGETLSAGRGFVLSGAYVFAMALAYATLGVAAVWSGQNLQIVLQTPIALGVMSLVFIALALSMFGLYELQLPSFLTARLVEATDAKGGSLGGAALLGFGSALIVGPCVTPPLAAALLYVAQTGDIVRGASALFALGLGMGLPLLAFGTFGSGLLPKSGSWLVRIKHIFGFVFIAMAVWMLSRVTPEWLILELWGACLIGLGLYLGATSVLSKTFWRNCRVGPEIPGVIALAFGTLFLFGSIPGNDLLRSLPVLNSFASNDDAAGVDFQTVTSPATFDAAMVTARAAGKPVLLDFSADWCIECKVIDRNVFGDPAVRKRLRDLVLIRADVTNYNEDSRALMQRFDVVGAPTIICINADTGQEVPDTRIIGPVDVEGFLDKVSRTPRV